MLKELYSVKMLTMPVDRQLYPYPTATNHLHGPGPITAKLAWCQDVAPAIHASIHQASKLGIRAHQTIQYYMRPNANNELSNQTDASRVVPAASDS